ncbi:MAG: hypothetical protein ABID71_03170 [Chloroflexota bacterium]
MEKQEFGKMKDEYYKQRGWEIESGLPTALKLEELELSDIASDLHKRGLLDKHAEDN